LTGAFSVFNFVEMHTARKAGSLRFDSLAHNEALLKEIDLIARLCGNNEAKLRQVAIANGIDPLKAEANSWYQNARAIALAIWPEVKAS
jgi:hypothetical protein